MVRPPRLLLLVSLTIATACGDSSGDTSGGGAGDPSGSGSGAGNPSSGSGAGTVGVPCGDVETRSGEGTYYDFADGSGNCGFPATPNDLMVAAMNDTDYAGSAVCGSCVTIDGPSGSVTVRIVDRCPECPAGDIDLSPDAFSQIAELSAGHVPITWRPVPCDVTGPVTYHFKDGSNPYWTAVQMRNIRHAIASFEVDKGNGFEKIGRVDYNYFVDESGMGEGPFTFRVTDVLGHELVDTMIPLLDDADAPGQAQFPACSQ
ncbi:MAG: expansin EXLX1 family cellulose-binding protein [Polyangiaceae bacterium]